MGFSTSDFRNSIAPGIQRSNKWEVEVNFPAFAAQTADSRDASLQARSTSTPAWTLGKIDMPFQGRIIPIPGDRTFADFTLTFVGVVDYSVRDAFEKWNNGINEVESNNGLSNLEDFMRDVTLYLLDGSGNRVKEYTLVDAYPSELGEMDLDMEAADTAAMFTITFAYVNLKSNTTS